MTDKAPSDLAAATVETPPEYTSIEDKAADILRQASSPAQDSPETGTSEETPAETRYDLKTVAERLQVDPATLYENLRIRAADDGEELSLGQLKDSYRSASELEKARGVLLEETTTSRKEVAQAQQELAILVQHLNRDLKPELLQEVSRLAENQRTSQSEALLKALPEWKDPIRKAADWADIVKVAQQAGYTEADMRLAQAGYADHRMIRLALLAAKPQKAPAEPRPKKVAVEPKRANPQTAAQQFGQLKAQVKQGRIRPEEAGARLLQGLK